MQEEGQQRAQWWQWCQRSPCREMVPRLTAPTPRLQEGCHISASPLQLMTLASAREMRFPPPLSAIPLENFGTTFEANKTFSAPSMGTREHGDIGCYP